MSLRSSLECRVCANSPLDYVKLVHGEHRHEDVPLYRCRSCGSHFSVPEKFAGSDEISQFNIVEWHLLAAEYNVRKMNALLGIVDERGWAGKPRRTFLDVGCGIGTALRVAQEWGYEAHGLEPEPNSADYARRNFQLNVQTAYLEPGSLPEQSFDVVMLDNVLEHVPNPRELFRTVVSLLKPEGTLFFGVPACDWIRRWLSISYMMPARSPTFDWRTTVGKSRLTQVLQPLDIFGYPEGHVNYFSRKAIHLLCEANNAEIVEPFYMRRVQALLYPRLGITTGYYFIRKNGAGTIDG